MLGLDPTCSTTRQWKHASLFVALPPKSVEAAFFINAVDEVTRERAQSSSRMTIKHVAAYQEFGRIGRPSATMEKSATWRNSQFLMHSPLNRRRSHGVAYHGISRNGSGPHRKSALRSKCWADILRPARSSTVALRAASWLKRRSDRPRSVSSRSRSMNESTRQMPGEEVQRADTRPRQSEYPATGYGRRHGTKLRFRTGDISAGAIAQAGRGATGESALTAMVVWAKSHVVLPFVVRSGS